MNSSSKVDANREDQIGGARSVRAVGLIAVDFDGTIVDRRGVVSPRTVRTFDTLATRGWVVVGATGRPELLSRSVVKQVGAMGFLVASNGAEVLRIRADASGGAEALAQFNTDLSADQATNAIAAIRHRWPAVKFCLGRVDGTQAWEPGFSDSVPVPPVGVEIADAADAIVGPVRTILVFGEPIERLGAAAVQTLDDAVAPVAPTVAVAESGLGLPEVRVRAVTKASALEALRDHLDISSHCTIAFGDGDNDHEMLRWADRGVAMANATEATLSLADAVTGSVEADGVASWLEQHVLRP